LALWQLLSRLQLQNWTPRSSTNSPMTSDPSFSTAQSVPFRVWSVCLSVCTYRWRDLWRCPALVQSKNGDVCQWLSLKFMSTSCRCPLTQSHSLYCLLTCHIIILLAVTRSHSSFCLLICLVIKILIFDADFILHCISMTFWGCRWIIFISVFVSEINLP